MGRLGDARMVQAGDEITQPLAALHLGSQRQPAPTVNPLLGDLVAVMHRVGWLLNLERADGPGQMAHVVATDHVVLIADAIGLNIAACQQQARHLQAARCQDEMSRLGLQSLAAQAAYIQRSHALTVGLQPDCRDIGMQDDCDIGC